MLTNLVNSFYLERKSAGGNLGCINKVIGFHSIIGVAGKDGEN